MQYEYDSLSLNYNNILTIINIVYDLACVMSLSCSANAVQSAPVVV